MEELISNASSKDHFTLKLIEQLNNWNCGRKKAFIKYINII